MKKIFKNIIFYLVILISLLACNPEIDYFHDSYFNAEKAKPLYCDIEIVNDTNKDIALETVFYEVGGRIRTKKVIFSNSDNVACNGKISKPNISIMNAQISYEISFSHVDGKGPEPRAAINGFSSIFLYEENEFGKTLLWNGAGEEKDYLDFNYNFDTFDNLGGDLYYVLDWRKDGTESFGELISTVPELNGTESGHIKICLTLTEDSDGKVNCTLTKL